MWKHKEKQMPEVFEDVVFDAAMCVYIGFYDGLNFIETKTNNQFAPEVVVKWAKLSEVIERATSNANLEPIVASLQGRADICAEELMDEAQLTIQWFKKSKLLEKQLNTAKETMETILNQFHKHKDSEKDGFMVNWDIVAASNAVKIENALYEINKLGGEDVEL